ncbi:hypothetical protein [Pedobacter agri]|uniref:hypothetical protein n=1 Tax=Pedobacter agri TaxID=454586 RepID=UPI002931D7D1|nr:hypothetical protein [Pedobacter agri]
MKILLYATAIVLASFSCGCKIGGQNLSLKTVDTSTTFKFTAEFDEAKTDKIEKYLDSALNNELSLNQNIDLLINLSGNDKFNLKAKKGWLEIVFDKRNSSSAGYMKVKKLTEGIQGKLTWR